MQQAQQWYEASWRLGLPAASVISIVAAHYGALRLVNLVCAVPCVCTMYLKLWKWYNVGSWLLR